MDSQVAGGQSNDFTKVTEIVLRWTKAHIWVFSLTAGLSTALLFTVLFLAFRGYQSEGFLQANRLLSELNIQRPALEDRANLLRYLQYHNQMDDPNASFLLQEIGSGMMQRQVRTTLTYSKEDLHYLSDAKAPLAASVLGLGIKFTAGSAEDAAARVQLMGDYLRDSMLRLELLQNIRAGVASARSQKQLLDNQLIAKRLELDEATRKFEALKSIAAKYPEASRNDPRQLLSSDTDSSRYLPPIIQLIGAESNIADLGIAVASLERNVAQNTLRLDFYTRANQIAAAAPTGLTMLAAFKALKIEVFETVNLDDDQVREVVNNIRIVLETLQAKHVTGTSFTFGPTKPQHRSGPRPLVLLVLALVFGSLLTGLAMVAFERVSGRSIEAPLRARMQR